MLDAHSHLLTGVLAFATEENPIGVISGEPRTALTLTYFMNPKNDPLLQSMNLSNDYTPGGMLFH